MIALESIALLPDLPAEPGALLQQPSDQIGEPHLGGDIHRLGRGSAEEHDGEVRFGVHTRWLDEAIIVDVHGIDVEHGTAGVVAPDLGRRRAEFHARLPFPQLDITLRRQRPEPGLRNREVLGRSEHGLCSNQRQPEDDAPEHGNRAASMTLESIHGRAVPLTSDGFPMRGMMPGAAGPSKRNGGPRADGASPRIDPLVGNN
jgi:hypothetical protein